jgi:hypothetical protein
MKVIEKSAVDPLAASRDELERALVPALTSDLDRVVPEKDSGERSRYAHDKGQSDQARPHPSRSRRSTEHPARQYGGHEWCEEEKIKERPYVIGGVSAR